jgi:hypothetical protein
MAEIIEERVQPVKIDASGVYYQDLNRQIKALAEQGVRRVELQNVWNRPGAGD